MIVLTDEEVVNAISDLQSAVFGLHNEMTGLIAFALSEAGAIAFLVVAFVRLRQRMGPEF